MTNNLDKAQMARVLGFVANAARSISDTWRKVLGDPRRDIDDECGYDKTDPSAHDYWLEYRRNEIAARVVEVLPKETWQITPWVYEKEDGETQTAFEKAWDELGKTLRGSKSWHSQEHGSIIWEYLYRLDILSGIGRYGVLLLGFNDIDPPSTEGIMNGARTLATPVTPLAGLKLMYVRPFPENLCPVSAWDQNPASPRFGMPETYSITFNDPNSGEAAAGLTAGTTDVHWSRVIHVAEDLTSGETFGTERMRPVWNRLRDLKKIYGASAEGYWKACFTLLTAETHPQLGGDVEIDQQEMKDMFEEMMNGLQRTGVLKGMSLKSTAPGIIDPGPFIDKQLEAICIKLACPVPVFKGYEIGEQASDNNKEQWDDRIGQRQNGHATSRLIVPLVDRLIEYKVLPEPESYCVEWPDLSEASAEQKANVSLTNTQAISAYVTSGANMLMTPFDFYTTILGIEDERAQLLVDNARDALEKDADEGGGSPLLGLVGGLTGVIELYKAAKEGSVTEDQLKEIIQLFFKLTPEQVDEMIADGIEVKEPDPIMVKPGTLPYKPGDKIPPAPALKVPANAP